MNIFLIQQVNTVYPGDFTHLLGLHRGRYYADGFWPLFNEQQTKPQSTTQRQRLYFKNGSMPTKTELSPEALAASHRDDVNWFVEGRAAMLPFSGGWITRYFDKSFEHKATPSAQPRGELGQVPANSQALVVPKASRNIEIATDFALFVTNDHNQLEFCRQVAILPSTKKAALDPYFS